MLRLHTGRNKLEGRWPLGVAGRTIRSQRVETFWDSEVRLAFPILVPCGLSLWGTNAGYFRLLSTGKSKGDGLSEGRLLLGCPSVGKHVNSDTDAPSGTGR